MKGGVGKELLNSLLGTELYGQHVNPPPGFSTSCVIYRLRQGSTGQEHFFTHQVAKLHELHDIILSYKGDGLSLEVNRPWFSQKIKDSTDEYSRVISQPQEDNCSLPPQNKPTTNETVEPDEDAYYLDIEAVLPKDVVLEDETVDAETVLPKDTILSESDSPFNCCCGAAGNGQNRGRAIRSYSMLHMPDPPKGWRRRALQNHLLILRKAKEGGVTTWDVKLWRDWVVGSWQSMLLPRKDIIEDFLEAPITEEIDEVLRCHIIILEDLLNVDLQTVISQIQKCPSFGLCSQNGKKPQRAKSRIYSRDLEHYGDLTLIKRLQSHWFSINIPSACQAKKRL
ncbi:hypothetical protein BDQ17DRAFT_1339305 [Cyathus striatus]|nr:hypothetical protein BDQ17DRAFT_1339305 [Cyathus striatus]